MYPQPTLRRPITGRKVFAKNRQKATSATMVWNALKLSCLALVVFSLTDAVYHNLSSSAWWKNNVANATILRGGSNTFPSSSTTTTPVFSLLVQLTFQDEQDKEQFLQDIQPVANHVRKNESDTLAYEVLLSDQDPLQVMILERYKTKEIAYLEIHKSSAPFLAFREKLQAMQDSGRVQVSGHSYLDSQVGFGDRVDE